MKKIMFVCLFGFIYFTNSAKSGTILLSNISNEKRLENRIKKLEKRVERLESIIEKYILNSKKSDISNIEQKNLISDSENYKLLYETSKKKFDSKPDYRLEFSEIKLTPEQFRENTLNKILGGLPSATGKSNKNNDLFNLSQNENSLYIKGLLNINSMNKIDFYTKFELNDEEINELMDYKKQAGNITSLEQIKTLKAYPKLKNYIKNLVR
jgi:hypothetical protein